MSTGSTLGIPSFPKASEMPNLSSEQRTQLGIDTGVLNPNESGRLQQAIVEGKVGIAMHDPSLKNGEQTYNEGPATVFDPLKIVPEDKAIRLLDREYDTKSPAQNAPHAYLEDVPDAQTIYSANEQFTRVAEFMKQAPAELARIRDEIQALLEKIVEAAGNPQATDQVAERQVELTQRLGDISVAMKNAKQTYGIEFDQGASKSTTEAVPKREGMSYLEYHTRLFTHLHELINDNNTPQGIRDNLARMTLQAPENDAQGIMNVPTEWIYPLDAFIEIPANGKPDLLKLIDEMEKPKQGAVAKAFNENHYLYKISYARAKERGALNMAPANPDTVIIYDRIIATIMAICHLEISRRQFGTEENVRRAKQWAELGGFEHKR